ncbi:Glycerophosphoryl diester phosphodiesterase family-domain-containing protein [Dipodascopsis uninucleata]
MKFGKNLPRNQVPEWSAYYLNYKSLKNHIRNAKDRAIATGKTDGPVKESYLTPFFYSLDRNLETVNSFYLKKINECSRRVKLLHERFPLKHGATDQEEIEDLVGALLELRGQLRMLLWFAEVNKRGFVKILKKLDKKTGVKEQSRYLDSKVLILPFASASEANSILDFINNWLAELSPGELEDGSSSSLSSFVGLRKQASSATMSGTPNLESVKSAIASNDVEALKAALSDIEPSNSKKVLLSTLQKAVSARSLKCVEYLLDQVDDLTDESDLRDRNIIHRHVVALGRQRSDQSSKTHPLFITPAENPLSTAQLTMVYGSDGENSTDETAMLRFILDHLKPSQHSALISRDAYKRTPLHYAAQFGMRLITEVIVEYLHKWDLFPKDGVIDSADWIDAEGLSPYHLAVIGNHPKTLSVLLNSTNGVAPNDDLCLLSLAAKSNYHKIIELLVEAGLSVNYVDEEVGETALYVASRFGNTKSVEILLKNGAKTEIAETTYGWTPLFIAAVEGFLHVVNLLLAYNCDTDKVDGSGWTVVEHAALRGHLDIAKKLQPTIPEETPSPFNSDVASAASGSVESLISLSSSVSSAKLSSSPGTVGGNSFTPNQEPVKSFGHRYLKNTSMILVTLGSTDTRSNVTPVQLDKVPFSRVHSTQLDTALSLVVWAENAQGEPTMIDLPIQDNQSTEPIVFYSDNPKDSKVFFDIVPTYAGNRKQIFGRAVALLSSIKTSVGQSIRSLHETITVPIVQGSTLDILGTVNFEFLIANAFTHPNMGVAKSSTYWKSLTTTRVIGHRGLGKNSTSRKSLQLGENTLQSFIAAANLGASYVEFDVQLTKDHVPVIYHDFLVAETGIDVPMHALTLEQFLSVSERRTPKSRSRNPSPRRDAKNPILESDLFKAGRRARSLSLEMGDEIDGDIYERFRFTRDFKTKGFKGNSRGLSIQAPFTTLEEVFKTLPKNVGFNIECKYPMLDESQAEDMEDLAIELNQWVDTVLKVVYDHADGRDIIFSSFHPDVCLMLSLKQPSIPILFLTEAGTMPMADIRASSLQEAIRFASRWNLLGLVSACEPLIMCPRLVRAVKESGLVCFSYGSMNNVPEYCKRQMKYGLDAVIVDSVLAVRKGLTSFSDE